jgi:RNA polymerase sigma factor (sigma-70 family)
MYSMSQPEPDQSERDSLATRASLLGRLRNWEDAESWEEFTRMYWRLIYRVARGAGLADAEARDVVQDTLLGVAKNVHEFQSNAEIGTFRSWLLNLTRWRIADYFRAQPRFRFASRGEAGEEPHTDAIERVADPVPIEALWDAEWKKILETAITRVSRRINPKHAQIFDLYAVRQWPCAKVTRQLKVSVVQVYLVSHRVRRLLKGEVAYLQSKLG